MKLSFHRPTSRILIAGTLCLVFLLGTVLGWANTHLLSADSRFEQFTEELFQKEVSGNMLNLHYSLAYPEKKGIQRPKATLGTISLPSSQLTDASSASLSNTSSEAEDFTSQTLKSFRHSKPPVFLNPTGPHSTCFFCITKHRLTIRTIPSFMNL